MLNDEPLLAVTRETNRILQHGLNAGIKDNEPPAAMLAKLRKDTFVFSGLKTHHQLKEAASWLLDDAGKLRSWEDFRKSVWSVHTSYNQTYLEPEYYFATGSAEMAAKWADFERDGGDRYNLQYRTAGDDRVRPDHQALNLTTPPFDDSFWNSYLPPLGWRCRCTTVQVRIGKYPVDDSAVAVAKGERATTRIDKNGDNKDDIFRFNPGKDRIIFPPRHPYRLVQDRVKEIVDSLYDRA